MNHKTQIPHDGPRVETGTLQLGDDWPGVFIRGDNALMHYLPAIKASINFLRSRGIGDDMLVTQTLIDLELLLKSCDARLHP